MPENMNEDPVKLKFGVLAAISAGGILEMCGGAPPEKIEFTVASICFAISLPLSVIGYLIGESIESRNRIGKAESPAEEAIWKIMAGISLTSTSMGIFAIFAYFSVSSAVVLLVTFLIGSGYYRRFTAKTHSFYTEEIERRQDEILAKEAQLERLQVGSSEMKNRMEKIQEFLRGSDDPSPPISPRSS